MTKERQNNFTPEINIEIKKTQKKNARWREVGRQSVDTEISHEPRHYNAKARFLYSLNRIILLGSSSPN